MASGSVILKTDADVEMMRKSALLVSKTLGILKSYIQPGVSTLVLDKIAEEFIRDNGGTPAFKGYEVHKDIPPFPASLCTSLNNEVVHGIPTDKQILQEGDIISVDCGVLLDGFFGDSAYTFPVGEVSGKKKKLMDVTKNSLYKAIQRAVEGNRMGDISHAVQSYVESFGYSVVREMVGHGLGRSLHEAPEVPNYGKKNTGLVLKSGLVIAIEPMINMGRKNIKISKQDNWTVFATDGQPSAHYEHTVVVRKDKPEILTTFEFIENS